MRHSNHWRESVEVSLAQWSPCRDAASGLEAVSRVSLDPHGKVLIIPVSVIGQRGTVVSYSSSVEDGTVFTPVIARDLGRDALNGTGHSSPGVLLKGVSVSCARSLRSGN